ncbi:ankyrin [Hypoxylon cercidicola]|nr:ankyrin [Hypoxylon cercidicola]
MPVPRRIPPAEWEDHKARIVELYLDQRLPLYGRSGQDGVIEVMGREGFVATKSQYEAQLRVWNVRKNMKLNEWTRIIPGVQESRQRRETLPIRLSGRAIPSSRIDKARRRYGLGRSQTAQRVASNNDRAALGSEVPSVSTGGGQMSLGGAVPEVGNPLPLGSTDGIIDDFDLNILDFNVDDAGANTLVNHTSRGQAGDDLAIDINMFSSNSLNLDQIYPMETLPGGGTGTVEMDMALSIPQGSSANPFFLDPASQLFTYHASSSTLRPNSVGTTLRPNLIFPRELWIGLLPSAGVMSMVSKGISSMGLAASTRSSVSGVARFNLVTRFFSDLEDSLNLESTEKCELISSFPRALACLAPDEIFVGEENQFAMLSSDDAFESRFFSRLIRSIMNCFAGLGNIPIEGLLRFLSRHHLTRSLLVQFLRTGPKPEVKSLAENLFLPSIQADDLEVVRLLLQLGLVDVNNTKCFVEGDAYTPLKAAARVQSFKVLKLLLDSKINVNKSAPSQKCPPANLDSPLYVLIYYHRHGSTLEQSFLDLVDDFLRAGATISSALMEHALVHAVDMRLASVLLDAFVSQDPIEVIAADLLEPIIKNLDENNATRIVKLAMEMCQDSDNQQYSYPLLTKLSSALDQAITRGYLELVRFLLGTQNMPLDKPFRSAIKKGYQEAINIILKGNPDLHMAIDGSTPLSAALESGNQELILLLEERGVLNRLRDNKLAIAIAAALRAGNLGYANKLLDLEHEADGQQLVDALAAALADDYDDIAWRLLAAGANTAPADHIYRRNGNKFPLFMAIRKRKIDMVRAMLECDLQPWSFDGDVNVEGLELQSVIEAVVDWGDRSVLIDILQAYSPFSGGKQGGLIRVLEKVNGDLMWMIIKSSSHGLRLACLRCSLGIAVKREDVSLLHQIFDFSILLVAEEIDEEDELLEALVEHPSMIEPLLKRLRQVYLPGFKENGFNILQKAVDGCQIYSNFLQGVFSRYIADCSQNGARRHDLGVLKQLLDAGCNLNAAWEEYNPHGLNLQSPLLAAIVSRNSEIVRFVIERGARVNEPTRPGLRRTPLQKAAEIDSLEIVRLLLEKGADVNAKASRRFGGTALQFAAIVGNCTMATELIEHGARLDTPPSRGPEGRWPLEGAAENGRIDMIQLLWYANCGRFDDKQCRKAMRLAERNGHMGCRDKIVELMSAPRPATQYLPVSWEGLLDDSWGEGNMTMFG